MDVPFLQLLAIVLVSIVDLLSITACFTVLCRICKLPQSSRGRLFPRQVSALAVADLFYICVRLPYNFRGFRKDGLGDWFLLMLYWSYMATLLAELGILLGFALQRWKCTRGLRALARLAWSPLLLAFGPALLSLLLRNPELPWHTVEAISALCTFAVALVTIAAMLCRRADQTTHAVTYRGWTRATAFVVNFLITMSPEVIFTLLFPDLVQGPMTGVRLGSLLCLHSNGLVNAITYLYQSRYAKRSTVGSQLAGSQLAASSVSLEVRFGGVDVEDLATPCELEDDEAL